MSKLEPTQDFIDFNHEGYEIELTKEMQEKIKDMTKKDRKIFFYYANMDKPSLRKLAGKVGVSFNTLSKKSKKFGFKELLEEYNSMMFKTEANVFRDTAKNELKDTLDSLSEKERNTDLNEIKIYDIYQYTKMLETKLEFMRELKAIYGIEDKTTKNIIEGNMEHSVSPDDLFEYLDGVKNEEHKDTV